MDKTMEKKWSPFCCGPVKPGSSKGLREASTKNKNIFRKPLLHPTNEYGLGSLNLHVTTFKKTMKITDLLTPTYTSMN